MAADNVARVLRVPGRLAYGCDDLTAAWPHGGTGLGATRAVVLMKTGGPYPVTCEAYGGEPVEYLEEGAVWGLSCTIRTVEDDALSQVFRNTASGSTSQRRVVTEPGSVRAGNWMSTRALTPLVFTPEGATHAESATQPDVRAPFIVLHRALPALRDDIEIPLERDQEWAVRVVFRGIRDSSGNILDFGPRVDLTL